MVLRVFTQLSCRSLPCYCTPLWVPGKSPKCTAVDIDMNIQGWRYVTGWQLSNIEMRSTRSFDRCVLGTLHYRVSGDCSCSLMGPYLMHSWCPQYVVKGGLFSLDVSRYLVQEERWNQSIPSKRIPLTMRMLWAAENLSHNFDLFIFYSMSVTHTL